MQSDWLLKQQRFERKKMSGKILENIQLLGGKISPASDKTNYAE